MSEKGIRLCLHKPPNVLAVTLAAFLECLDFLVLLTKHSGNNAQLQVLEFEFLYNFKLGWPTFDFVLSTYKDHCISACTRIYYSSNPKLT